MPRNHRVISSPSFRLPTWAICLTMLASLSAAPRAAALTLYVAPGGNDAWSGQREKIGPNDGPLASLTGGGTESDNSKNKAACSGTVRQWKSSKEGSVPLCPWN